MRPRFQVIKKDPEGFIIRLTRLVFLRLVRATRASAELNIADPSGGVWSVISVFVADTPDWYEDNVEDFKQ